MESSEVLLDAFSRIREVVLEVVDGLSADQLAFREGSEANSIAWLVWHLTRVQDDHVCGVAGREQAWVTGGWAERFGLDLDVRDTGYGHNPDQVAVVKANADLLSGYHQAVFENTADYLKGLSSSELDRVVDRRWDPPVTLGVRLVSVVADDLQHAGQAAFVRGAMKIPLTRRLRPHGLPAFDQLEQLVGALPAGGAEDLAGLLPRLRAILRAANEDEAG